MGNLCSGTSKKKKKGSLIKIKSQNDNCYYKPKKNSNALLCYDPEKKIIKEELIDLKFVLKSGCMLSKLGPCLYICIGGIESSDSVFLIHLNEKKISTLPNPPMNLAYGHINKYKDKIYVVGAFIIENLITKKSAPPLCFDLKSKK